MAPSDAAEKRAAAASSAVHKFCPKGVDAEIADYIASTASSMLEEAESNADREALQEELEAAIGPFLEDHGVSGQDTAAFCQKVIAAAFEKKGSGSTSGGAAPTPSSNSGGAASTPSSNKGKAGKAAKPAAGSAAADCLCRVENMMLMYGGSPVPLLNKTTLELLRGHRYGVVGANGAGKTTLMSRIAAREIQGIPKHLTCVHLRHETILDGIDPKTSAREYARRRGSSGGSATDADVNEALRNVGFDSEDMLSKAVSELSGGWRMRLALACAMAQRADVLLLDEPTNHLDTKAVAWLVEFVNRACTGEGSGGTAMIVSHEPDFLNQVCTDIVHFTSAGKLAYYPGNFDNFKENLFKGDEGEAKKVLDVIRDSNIAGGGSMMPSEYSAPVGDDNRMSFPIPEKIVGITASKPVLTLNKAFFTYDEARGPVLKDVTVRLTLSSRIAVVGRNGAGKSTLMSMLAGELNPCSVKENEPAGELQRHRHLRLAYIAQQHMFHLGEFLKCTPMEYIQLRFRNGYDEEAQQRLTLPQTPEEAQLRKELARKYGKRGKEVQALLSRQKKGKDIMYEVKWKELDDPKQNTYEPLSKLRLLGVERMAAALDDRLACAAAGTQLRPLTTREIVKHLEPFGMTEDMTCHRAISMLSGGQKSKLMLGAAFWTKPHLVCLDEPTNYLDVETVEALSRALRNFRGGCVVVTHNEKFIDDVCEEVWDVADGQVTTRSKAGGPGKAMKAVSGSKETKTAKVKASADKDISCAKKAEAKAAMGQEESLAIYLEARNKLGAAKTDIKVTNFDLDAPDGTPLLRDTNLQLTRGRRYGLAGRNGAGKSTLLRAIARYQVHKNFPKNVKVLLVEQEAAGDDRKALQTLLDGDLEMKLLRDEEAKLLAAAESGGVKDEARLKAIHERLEEIGAADAEARAARILRGLQFTPDLLEKGTRALSGGWRMRVSLAMALFAQPDLLLLDEPTNHLDFPAVLWLEDYMNEYKETAIIVSHDRHFLDNVATDIMQLQSQRLNYYRGGYTAFTATAREQRLAQQRAYDAQLKQIEHIEEYINRFDMQLPKEERAKKHPSVVAQIESRKRQLEKMERIDDPAITYGDSENLSFRFPDVGALRKDELVRLDRVTFGFGGGPPLFAGTDLRVDLKSRVGVLGRNGAGKSTLLKVMTGELTQQKGDVSINRNMRTAVFAQHHVDTLDITLSCIECVQGRFPDLTDQQVRNMLGRMGIQGDMALRRVKTLSGGQKSRVALAIVTQCQPHLIVLDEPTNHLDMETIDALIEAIENFDGAVVFVSHDQYFLSKVATELWAVANGSVRMFRDLEEAKQFTYKACEVRG